jgi:hypothetical protein
MERVELSDFYNSGFGWICKHCERELTNPAIDSKPSRLIREGEAESKTVEFSNVGLAKWTDKAQETLICPRCGITELANRS